MAEADPGFARSLATVPEVTVADAEQLDARLRDADQPFIVRGLVADWPLVQAGRRSAGEARRYIARHARQHPFTVSVGAPGSGGRLFYDDAMAMNFRTLRAPLPDIFAKIAETEGQVDAP
ncbi:cupin-like domain-containing protein, partial [uncultured Sphingomonas sp.]|uniref:cupin-like domain-containing protein n=1 Tax=uncultured Sphingomonas sp. TaxID=158754 RepID=UPI0035C9961D